MGIGSENREITAPATRGTRFFINPHRATANDFLRSDTTNNTFAGLLRDYGASQVLKLMRQDYCLFLFARMILVILRF